MAYAIVGVFKHILYEGNQMQSVPDCITDNKISRIGKIQSLRGEHSHRVADGREWGVRVSHNTRKDKGELIAASSHVPTRVGNGASIVQRQEFPTTVSQCPWKLARWETQLND